MKITELLEYEAFHGSPKKFKKFKSNKTRDKALFGWGVYVTKDLALAGNYSKIDDPGLLGDIYFMLGTTRKGWLYYLDINIDENDMIDLNSWSTDLVDVITRAFPSLGSEITRQKNHNYKLTNITVYDLLAKKLGSEKAASLWLSEKGFKGAKGDWFEIIYDPKLIKIVKKEPVAVK